MMKTDKPFTMQDALAIQAEHLAMWESILKPEVFAVVKEKVLAENTPEVTNPYDVCRGCHIDGIVHNLQVRPK